MKLGTFGGLGGRRRIFTLGTIPEATLLTLNETSGVYTADYTYSHGGAVPEKKQDTQWLAATITGDTLIDSILTASIEYAGLPAGETFTYQWYVADDNQGANDAALAGETGTTLTLVDPTHLNKYIRFEATDSNGDTYSSYYTDQIGYASLPEYVFVNPDDHAIPPAFGTTTTITDTVGNSLESGETGGNTDILISNPFAERLRPNGLVGTPSAPYRFKSVSDTVRSVIGGTILTTGQQVIDSLNGSDYCEFHHLTVQGDPVATETGISGLSWSAKAGGTSVVFDDIIVKDCYFANVLINSSIDANSYRNVELYNIYADGHDAEGELVYVGSTNKTANISNVDRLRIKNFAGINAGRDGLQVTHCDDFVIESSTFRTVGVINLAGHNRLFQIHNSYGVVKDCIFHGAPEIGEIFAHGVSFANCVFIWDTDSAGYIGKLTAGFTNATYRKDGNYEIIFNNCYFLPTVPQSQGIFDIVEDECQIGFSNCKINSNVANGLYTDNRVDKVTYSLFNFGTTVVTESAPVYEGTNVDDPETFLVQKGTFWRTKRIGHKSLETNGMYQIEVYFSDEVEVTDATGWTVNKNDVGQTINYVEAFLNKVIITINDRILPNDIITVSYNDVTGNLVAYPSSIPTPSFSEIIADNYLGSTFLAPVYLDFAPFVSNPDPNVVDFTTVPSGADESFTNVNDYDGNATTIDVTKLQSENTLGDWYNGAGETEFFKAPEVSRGWSVFDNDGDTAEQIKLNFTGFNPNQFLRVKTYSKNKNFGQANFMRNQITGRVVTEEKYKPTYNLDYGNSVTAPQEHQYFGMTRVNGSVEWVAKGGVFRYDQFNSPFGQWGWNQPAQQIERVADFDPRNEDFETLLIPMGAEQIATSSELWRNWGSAAATAKNVGYDLPSYNAANRQVDFNRANSELLEISHSNFALDFEVWAVFVTPASFTGTYHILSFSNTGYLRFIVSGALDFANGGTITTLSTSTEYRIRLRFNGASSTVEVRDGSNAVIVAETTYALPTTAYQDPSIVGASNTFTSFLDGGVKLVGIKPTAFDTAGKNDMFTWIHNKIK